MGKWKSKGRTKESEMRWGKIFRVVEDNEFSIRYDEVEESFQAKASTGHLTL